MPSLVDRLLTQSNAGFEDARQPPLISLFALDATFSAPSHSFLLLWADSGKSPRARIP